MTNFTMPNNISSMKYALESVPDLADVGVPQGDGDGPQNFTQMSASKAKNCGMKATSLVPTGRSGMDKNPSCFFPPSFYFWMTHHSAQPRPMQEKPSRGL